MLTLSLPRPSLRRTCCLLAAFGTAIAAHAQPEPAAQTAALAAALHRLDTKVLGDAGPARPAAMLEDHARAALEAANRRETTRWREVRSREDWERYRDARIARLRESLGPPPPQTELKVRVTGANAGDGYRLENLVFESRPGLLVTASLYLPASPPAKPMPGILLCHSHHHPKEEAELQDMGVAWARSGCAVLAMDHLGHGERRQHPFPDASSYPGPFRAGRQDYYFRYNAAMQLHAADESLIGWMVHDLLRGVDLLLSRPGVAADRILLLGGVAGGGDPAAVAAALDQRIAAVVPFNFGGPQPETRFPLPADAEESFGYAGGGSWESTRNLRSSARDGFLPWVIVGAVAPRRLVYAHEFSWDRERDPVWRRLEAIYRLHGAGERLAFTHGRGTVSGPPAEATHCNNIGVEHRRAIHEAFERWFAMAPPDEARRDRRPAAQLRCLTDAAAAELRPRPLHELLLELGRARVEEARHSLKAVPLEGRREELRRWSAILDSGSDAASDAAGARILEQHSEPFDGGSLERITLATEEGIVVPLLLLVPGGGAARQPVVVAFAQEGKRALLDARRGAAAAILAGGAALCLPDLRGTGETQPADGARGRRGASTEISSTYLMLGRTLAGARLLDLCAVLAFLRHHPAVDASRLALWGDSLAPSNAADREVVVPLDAEPAPALAEPLGGLMAILGGLYAPGVRAIAARGGLESFESLLRSPFVHVPHDALVPGALLAGDVPAVVAALEERAPGGVLVEAAVDGLNRRERADEPVLTDEELARWLLGRLGS